LPDLYHFLRALRLASETCESRFITVIGGGTDRPEIRGAAIA